MPGAGTAVNTATQADAVGAFSADNTGAADATAQIQSAVDSLIDATGLAGGANGKPGGFTVLRDGTYKTKRPIWIGADNVSLKGQSQLGTIIQPQNEFPAFIVGHKRQMAWNRSTRYDSGAQAGR